MKDAYHPDIEGAIQEYHAILKALFDINAMTANEYLNALQESIKDLDKFK